MLELNQQHLNVVTALKLTLQEYYQESFDMLDAYYYDEDSENYFFGNEEGIHVVVRIVGEYETETFEEGKSSYDIYEVFGLVDDWDNAFTIRFEEENEHINGLSRRITIDGEVEEDIPADIEAIFWEKYAMFH